MKLKSTFGSYYLEFRKEEGRIEVNYTEKSSGQVCVFKDKGYKKLRKFLDTEVTLP